MAIKFLIWILSCSSVYGAAATDETQDAARIESFHYQTVNPGAESEVNCTVSGNPLPEESNVVLTVGDSSAEISNSTTTDKGGSITYYWSGLILHDGVVIQCKIKGQPNAIEERNVSLYTLPSYESEPVLKFSRITSTSMNVSWPAWEEGTDPGDGPIKAYKLKWREGLNGPFDNVYEGKEHSYLVENHTPRSRYFFKLAVVRVGLHGEGPFSEEQEQLTITRVFNAKANPGALSTVTCNVRGKPLPAEESVVLIIGNSSQQITPERSNVENGIRRCYWDQRFTRGDVISCSVIGQELRKDADVKLFTLPYYRREQVLTFSRVTSTSMIVSWPAWEKGRDPGDDPIIAYKLYRRKGTDGTFRVDYEGEALGYYVENLEPSTGYFFQLAVVRDGENGEGPLSSQQEHMTCRELDSPVLTVNNQMSTQVTFTVELPPEGQLRCGQRKDIILQKQIPGSNDWTLNQTLDTSSERITVLVDALIPCTSYEFRVMISTTTSTLAESNIVNATTEAEAPGKVISLRAIPQEQRSLTVTWAPPSMENNACQIDKYIIVYQLLQHEACDPGEDASAGKRVEQNGTRQRLERLEKFARYEIKVSAVISGDAPSQNLQGPPFKVTESTLPSAPSGQVTSLRSYRTQQHSLSFTWGPLPCKDHNGNTLVYQLELMQRNRNGSISVVQRANTSGTSKTFNDLKACGDYKLKVTPRNSQHLGTAANSSGFATTSEADLGKVRSVTTTLSGNDITVHWQAPDDANNLCPVNSYKLLYALQRYIACEPGVPNENYVVKEDIAADVNQYILSDMQPFSIYRIQMVAKHHDTFGQLSETEYITTGKQNPPAVRSVRVNESFSTSRELKFTWDPISCENLKGNFLRYTYRQNGTSGVEYITNQDTDSVQLTALNPCTVYQFQIRVVNDFGAGPYSTMTTGKTEEEAPGSDFNLRLTSVGPRSFKAVWRRPRSHPCTITGQKIIIRLREDVCGNSSRVIAESISSGIWEKTFEDLLPYSKYTVGIRASNSAGHGDWNYTAGRTEEDDPSGPPEEVGLRQKSSTMLKFGWKRPACGSRNGEITGYYYMFRNSAEPDQDVRTEFIGSSRTKSFTNLIPYTTYTLQVRARTKTGFGPYSDPITNTTDEDIPPAPDTPESVSSNTSTIQISWRAPNPPHGVILGYNISYSNGEEIEHFSDVVVSGPEEPLTAFITNLQPDSIYSVRVSARTRVGQGAWSSPLLKETKEDVPGEPSDVSVIHQTKHSLEISWNVPKKPNGKVTKYRIRVLAVKRPYITGFTEEDGEDVFVDATSDRMTYNITDLDPSTDYKLTVTAHTSAGEGKGVSVIGKTELFTDLDPIPPEHMEKIASSIRRGESDAVFTLPALRQDYATGYFINITTVSKSKRSAAMLHTYGSNQNEYIAAEIAKSGEDTVFTLGDGKNYSDYYNAPLQKDREYSMSIGVCSKTDEDVEVKWSSQVEISAYRSGNAVLIIILLLILFCCVFVLVAAAFLYKRRKQTKEEEEKEVYARVAREQRDKPDIVVLQNGSPEELELQNANKKNQRGQKPAVPKKPKNPGKTVKIAELSAYIKKKKASETDNFLLEYEALPDSILYPCQAAEKPQNKRKNRYGNIIPYDSSRVVLQTLEGDPHSDYINASYIDGYNYPTKYIASHGPNTASVKDFWRMIWQEDVGKIVMLTNVVEMGKKKCEKYWPDEALKYNNVIVTLVTEKKLAAYTIRTFNLQSLEDEDVVKTVIHYHFTAWPDMKVPDFAGPILELLQVVRSDDNHQSGPLVVHCSAGVGRTGTYITLDAMLDMADAEGKINVFGFVTQMRENRVKMVQIAEQYQFIFDALLEHFIIGKTSIETANLRTELSRLKEMNIETGRSYLQDQFETLQLISVTPPDGKLKGGKSRENYSKNRYPGRIPVDTYRPYLMTDVGAKGNNYINATFMSGYSKKDMFLGTQMPLPNTVLDFWRMIWDYNSYVIVMLNDMDDKSMAQYWSEPGTFDCGPFTVTQLSCDDQNGVRYRKLELVNSSQTNDNPRIIMHLQCLDWPNSEETPRSLQTMLYAINMINQWESETDLGPITVHCIDGIGRTGIFCALLSALDQTKSEDKVDIFQLVNKLRTSRPSMVENYLQYQCIFDSVLSHLEDPDDSNIYENYSR
ncbi:receptor-type tyrosine-protein phosphatase S-like isoform X2 [Apostichopus japonicus]|uniref:receptor-type tyrosine-protein phosphatase S-like isoform X2 n=1 Tax=Stichopus japonicus TaxID=307972 RepID=UPI003AB13809